MKTVRCSQGLAFLMILTTATVVCGQNRYSLNAVGYVDGRFYAGSNLMANPLKASDNSISQLLRGLPAGSFYLPWNPAQAGFGPTNHLTDQGWTDGSANLLRRDAGFLWVPEARTVSFVGEPWPGECIQYRPGFTVSAVLPRFECAFCANFNDCRIFPEIHISQWDRARQSFVESSYLVDFGWMPADPVLAPDEAAIIFQPSAQTIAARSMGPGIIPAVPLFKPRVMGTNFYFEFPSANGVMYSVQRSENITGDGWETVFTATTTTADAFIPVLVPMTGKVSFYRLNALRMFNPSRAGTEFQFQFYAERGTQYQISRSPSLEEPSWQTVGSIDGDGTTVTFRDANAAGPVGYYRLQY